MYALVYMFNSSHCPITFLQHTIYTLIVSLTLDSKLLFLVVIRGITNKVADGKENIIG